MDSERDRDARRAGRPVVRPLPRPLFSAGSLNSNTTQGSSTSSDGLFSPPPHSRTPSNSTDPTGDNPSSGDPRSAFLAGATVSESPVSSPTLLSRQSPSSPNPSPFTQQTQKATLSRSRPVKKSSLLSNVTSSSDIVAANEPSQSKRRWDEVRHHFLPARAAQAQRPATPPPAPDVPQRPSTPKQFRIPKLGLRQVVEQAQESVVDQHKRFADDILGAIRGVRTFESKASRREREGTLATMATSFNMSFVASSASLGMASIPTSNHQPQSRSRATRRPPSLQSVAAHSPIAASSLFTIISHYASIAHNQVHVDDFLPYESEVLSALSMPFMTPRSEITDNERLQTLETFETIVRTWPTPSDEAFLERCLWCCRVARMIQDKRDIRLRVLGALSICLFSSGRPPETGWFVILQTLFQALFSLQGSLLAEGDSEGASYVHELITGVRKVGCEGLDASLLMQQYGVQLHSEADAQAVLDCVVIMALAICTESTTISEHRYISSNVMAAKENWFNVAGSSHYSPSLMPIVALSVTQLTRALSTFLLPTDGPNPSVEDFHLVFKVLTDWSIPVTRALADDGSFDCKVTSARLALSVLFLSGKETREAIGSLITKWYHGHSQWKAAFEAAIPIVVKENKWEAVVAILLALMDQLPHDLRSSAAAKFLPALNEKLVLDPPPLPFFALTELFEIVSQKLPKLFYRPLFACAAGTKTSSILSHLRTVAMVARYLPSFWIRDAEMLLVALMSDSSGSERNAQENATPSWGQVYSGQLVLFVELIAHIQAVRQDKDGRGPSSSSFLAHARFFFELEHRLGLFIDKKERTLLIPVPQRILLVNLFFEIRLLLRSLKSAQWLPRVISWVVSSEDVRSAQHDSTSVLEILTEVYGALQRSSFDTQKRKSTPLLSPSVSVDGASPAAGTFATAPPVVFSTRARQLKDFSKGLITNSLRLLVAVSGLLWTENHESLCAFLWQRCLTQAAFEVQALATFLIMQCAEKAPTATLNVMEADIRSPHVSHRLVAACRLSIMSGWRFQMLSQGYIVDKNHRRPFKLARVPMSFLPTDIGSSSFVLREDLERGNSSSGQVLPLELRKRLADIGWTQDESTKDQKHEWIMTPFSLISWQQLEKVEAGLPMTMGTRSPQPGALESPPSPAAETIPSTHGVKRRPIFVPPLVSILPDLASLVNDGDYGVANAARVVIMDWMRHDPALITRPALDTLSGGESSLHSSFSILRRYLYAQSALPPAMAHHVFNHLTGFLKFSTRQGEDEDTLTRFAYAVPLLSKLVTQVSDMSLRELRRAKVDAFLIPSGSLWFSSSTSGPMSPRSLSGTTNGSDRDAVFQLGKIVLVRVAQNLLFVNMLKRDPQEVQAFRKNMPRLVLPTSASAIAPSAEPRSFVPSKEGTSSGADADISGLSLLLSRSHVLLVTEIFRSMPRHLNDRSELAVLIDGLNQILFVHGRDIGIVAHVLIALMTASARFHRLFTSGGGYTLFIPALFKVYAEAESNEGVRRAIEYSVNRFYAVHQEAFVFQALNMLSYVVMLPEVDGPWIAKQIFLLLSTLNDDAPVHAPDTAGIHGSNKTQEQESLMLRTAEEKPQTFLTILRRSSGSQGAQGEDVGFPVPDQYDGGHLSLDNFVRLLLTVIGHDPSIRRAEQFLRLLRLMAPHFYDTPVSRGVLQEGINALSTIFVARGAGKTKATENTQIRVEQSSRSFSQAAHASMDALEAAKSPSNFTEMRFDYLALVEEFSKSGGSFGSSALGRILDLAKMMLRDSDPVGSERVASFLGSFAHNILVRNTHNLQLKQILSFLNELGPIFKVYAGAADFSKTLEVILCLVENPTYASQPAFSLVVVTHFCTAGLEVFERLASDGFAFSIPFRTVLVRLLCRATLLTGTDIVSIIERRPITFEFVAGILYPMALNLPSVAEIVRDPHWMEAWRRTAIRRAWICILQQVMQACQRQGATSTGDRAEKSSQPERRRSQEKKRSVVKNYPAATLSIALQTLKIVVLRAEDELSVSLPSIWIQIGLLLKNVLSAGSARFAIAEQGASVPSSPLQPSIGSKLRTSEDSDLLIPSSPRAASIQFRSPSLSLGRQPSVVDYLLWSTLEFICRHSSPLVLQMRLFLREATATLDDELRAQQVPAARSKRFSYTSVFAKTPRKSGQWSKAPSPETSPFLAPIQPYHAPVLLTPPKPERQPGYARSPTTPGGSEVVGPRIVHLGPVQDFDVFLRSQSPGLGEGGTKSRKWLMANSTIMRSAKLVLATYRRIRAVQRIMGYTELIAAPDGAEGSVDDVRVWSKRMALDEIEGETADLMEEFSQQDE